jgi:hypothetical protein
MDRKSIRKSGKLISIVGARRFGFEAMDGGEKRRAQRSEYRSP